MWFAHPAALALPSRSRSPYASFLLVSDSLVSLNSQDHACFCTALGSQVASLHTVVPWSIQWGSRTCLHVGQSLQPWRRQRRGSGGGPNQAQWVRGKQFSCFNLQTHCWDSSWYWYRHKNLGFYLLYNPSWVLEVGHEGKHSPVFCWM